jgi:tetratricopeptide (TPR) repeat protein
VLRARQLRWLIACCAASLFVVLVLPLAAHINAAEIGFAPRVIFRSALCLTLATFACLPFVNIHSLPRSYCRDFKWALVFIAIALLLPGSYAWEVAQRRAATAHELLAAGQLAAAQRAIDELCALGSSATINELRPLQTQRLLAQTIAQLEESLVKPPPADAEEVVEFGRRLAALARYDEAIHLLAPLAPDRADAALLLAAVLQRAGRYDDSTHWYQHGLPLAAAQLTDDALRDAQVRAYSGIAFNARALGRHADAERAYQAGLQACPLAAAHFYFQWGRHYQLAGRPLRAIDCLERAAQLDAANFREPAGTLIAQIRRQTPACLLHGP